MIQIRPVSELRDKYQDIEKLVNEGEPVYLTKNGYGSMVVLSIDMYSKLLDKAEMTSNEINSSAEEEAGDMTHEEVFYEEPGIKRMLY